jgi:hypothetical protein
MCIVTPYRSSLFPLYSAMRRTLNGRMLELLQAGAKQSGIYIACPIIKLQQLTSQHIENLHTIALSVQTHLHIDHIHQEAKSYTPRLLRSTTQQQLLPATSDSRSHDQPKKPADTLHNNVYTTKHPHCQLQQSWRSQSMALQQLRS